MTIPAFHFERSRNRSRAWGDLVGGAVGLMYGEVMSYLHVGADIRTIDVDMCRSTLSYVLMRSIALGGCERDIDVIAKDWLTLRKHAGLPTRIESCDLIVDIARSWEGSRRGSSLFGSGGWPSLYETRDLFGRLKTYGEFPIADGNLFGLESDAEVTAEQRVRIFDEVARKVVEERSYKSDERGMVLAQLAFWCRKGLANQWAILQPFKTALPECAIWLGALQAQEPMADTLFVGRAVGWKLGIELFKEFDPFDAPGRGCFVF